LVRPLTVAVVAPVVMTCLPPGLAVTMYPVIGEPPLLSGAVQDTTARPFPGIAVTPLGALGAVITVGGTVVVVVGGGVVVVVVGGGVVVVVVGGGVVVVVVGGGVVVVVVGGGVVVVVAPTVMV